MRILLLSVLLLFTAQSYAVDCEDYSPFNFYPGPKNLTLGFSLQRSVIEKGPKWDLKSEPPLSIPKAIELSNSALSDLDLGFRLKFAGIYLRMFGCNAPDSFYYDVVYHTFDSKDRMWGQYNVIVLLSGAIELPIPIEHPRY